MDTYINIIRNNLSDTKTNMCVARYTNTLWAHKTSNYINNNIMNNQIILILYQ